MHHFSYRAILACVILGAIAALFFYFHLPTAPLTARHEVDTPQQVEEAKLAASKPEAMLTQPSEVDQKKSNSITSLPPTPVAWVTQFENSRDLKALFDHLLFQAEAGDATAQAHLARIIEACALYSAAPDYFMGLIQQSVPNGAPFMPGENKAAYNAMLQKTLQRCHGFTKGEIRSKDKNAWYEQAAKGGNLVALVREMALHFKDEPVAVEKIKDVVDRVIASRDPEAIFHLRELMGPTVLERKDIYGPYSGEWEDSYAWQLVACDLGYPCSLGSTVLDERCYVDGLCGFSDLRAVFRNQLSPVQYEYVERRKKEIMEFLSGNH